MSLQKWKTSHQDERSLASIEGNCRVTILTVLKPQVSDNIPTVTLGNRLRELKRLPLFTQVLNKLSKFKILILKYEEFQEY